MACIHLLLIYRWRNVIFDIPSSPQPMARHRVVLLGKIFRHKGPEALHHHLGIDLWMAKSRVDMLYHLNGLTELTFHGKI